MGWNPCLFFFVVPICIVGPFRSSLHFSEEVKPKWNAGRSRVRETHFSLSFTIFLSQVVANSDVQRSRDLFPEIPIFSTH